MLLSLCLALLPSAHYSPAVVLSLVQSPVSRCSGLQLTRRAVATRSHVGPWAPWTGHGSPGQPR